MATTTVTTTLPNTANNENLRMQMETLLFDFYGIVGVAPQRDHAALANELLAEGFLGRFYIQATNESFSFNKTEMLGLPTGRLAQKPTVCQLITMKIADDGDADFSATYSVSLRYGQTLMVRRGVLKAIDAGMRLRLASIEEDVRLAELGKSVAKRSVAFDRPRIWIV